MAVDLSAEVKKRKIADALTGGDDEPDPESEQSTDEPETIDSTEEPTDSSKETAAPEEPAATASRREAGFLSFSDYSGTPAASPTPGPAKITYPTIAEDQPAPDYVPSPAAVGPAQPVQPETAAAQPETVPAGHIDLGPPGGNIYTDPDTGGRYTIDPDTGQMVPHAELATAADKAAMPPGDVGLPRAVVTSAAPAPDRLTQVERAELVQLPPGVRGVTSYTTKLSNNEENEFQAWVKRNNIPWKDEPNADYDMRGYWKAQQEGDPNAVRSSKNLHFPDTYKTPFHKTFSNESQYATASAPHWEGDRLIDRNGNVVADETPGQKTVQPAPDRLTQVERGQLVKLPAGQPAPDTLSQVEKGIALPPKVQPAQPVAQPQAPSQAAPVTGDLAQGPPGTQPAGTRDEPYWPKTPEQIGQLPAGSMYVDPRDGSLKTTPGEKAAAQSAPVPTVQPTQGASARQAAGFLSFDDYAHPKPAAAQQPAAVQPVTTNPNGSDFPERVQAVGNNDPVAFITHHTSGRGTVQGVLDTLNQRGLGVEYVMDRDGNIFQTGGPGAQNILAGWGKGEGLSNQNIVGMEVIAKDNNDVTDAQKQSFARFMALRYPNTPIYGHGEVNPGHKEEDEGQATKAAALAYRDKLSSGQVAETTTAPSAQPVTKLKSGFYQDEKPGDFLTGRVTTFATPDDIASGQDNGVGSKHLGELDTTQVAGVAIPQAALQQMFGRDWAAAARAARVDVVDSATGKRLRVPIVDLGPSTDAISDMTPALASYFGGDKNLSIKIVPKAGPDVMKNPQLFYDEQAAIKNGFDSSSLDAKRQVIGQPQAPLRAQTSEEAAAAQKTVQAAIQKQQDTLTALQAKSANMPDWYQTLQSPIPGVSDAMRQAVAANYKQEVTKYAQDYYNEPDPDKAFARIMSAPNLLTSAGEIWTKAGANFQHAWLSIAQQADSPTQTKLIDFVNAVQPDATPEARTALINQVMSKTGRDRVDFVNHLYNAAQVTHPDTVQNVNMYSLLDAIDVSAQPGMQAKEAANHARVTAAVNQNLKDLREDPTMENTYGGTISNAIAQLPKNILEAITPVIGQSAMFSEIYTDTIAGLRKDHPDWSDDQIKAKAAAASLPQDVLQELVNAATLGMGSGLTKGITNPIARIAANAIMHGGIAATAGTTQQAMANVATGRPITEGLTQAAVTGGIQGVIGGVISGRHPAEAAPEERPAVVQPPPVEPPRAAEQPPPRPVTPADVLGPETPETMPWYKPGPIVTRAGEPEAFSPAGLAAGVAGMRAGGTPEEMRQAAENLQPAADFSRLNAYLGDEGQAEIYRALEAQRQPLAVGPTEAPPPSRPLPPEPGRIGEAEPWISREANKTTASGVANIYTKERMASGELAQIDPNVGITTEELLARGARMGPEAINQHVSDLMNGKGGNLRDQAAAIRMEEARLTQRARQLSFQSEENPGNRQLKIDAENAYKDLSDFHAGPVKKMKDTFHVAGVGLQGEPEVDLSTFNGLREKFLKETGQNPPPSAEPRLRKVADQVRKTHAAEYEARNKVVTQAQNERRSLPSEDEVRSHIMRIMKDLPCPN